MRFISQTDHLGFKVMREGKPRGRILPATIVFLLSAASIIAATGRNVVKKDGDGVPCRPMNQAESNVWQSVLAGGVGRPCADDGNDKAIRACLLPALLTNSAVPHQGVRVANAVVRGPVDLTNMRIAPAIAFYNCEFDDAVDFSSAHFSESVTFTNCVFKGEVSFEDAKLEGDLTVSRATFFTNADFTHTEVGADLDAGGCWFGGEALFTGVTVGHAASFDSQPAFSFTDTIREPVTNSDARAVVNAQFVGNDKLSPDFELEHPDGDVQRLSVVDRLSQRAYWLYPGRSTEEVANVFHVFRVTYFSNVLDFSGGSVAKQLKVWAADFRQRANFNSLKVEDSASLDESIFEDDVTWGFAGIKNQFSANRAIFNSPHAVDFFRLHCGEADLQGTTFAGGAGFGGAEIGGDLEAQDAVFRSTHTNEFLSIKVGGSAYFSRANFKGPVSFRYGDIQNLYVASLKLPDHAQTNLLRLEGLKYKRIVASTNDDMDAGWKELKRVLANYSRYSDEIYGTLASYYSSEGQSDFADQAYLEGKLQERIQTLEPSGNWGRFIFRAIGFGSTPELAFSWNFPIVFAGVLMFWLGQELKTGGSPSFQKFLPRCIGVPLGRIGQKLGNLGRPGFWIALVLMAFVTKLVVTCFEPAVGGIEGAKLAFLSALATAITGFLFFWPLNYAHANYKTSTRRAFLPLTIIGAGVFIIISLTRKWILNWVLFLTIGYGRAPVLAAGWSLLIIFAGVVLFKNMEPAESKGAGPNLMSRFFYTFDLFFPIIDLKTYDRWKPAGNNEWILWVGYCYRILGFILIPIWAAALTGLIK